MFVYGLLDKSVGDGMKTQTTMSQQIPGAYRIILSTPDIGCEKLQKRQYLPITRLKPV